MNITEILLAKRFVYMEIIVEAAEEEAYSLADIIDERLHRVVTDERYVSYRGFVPSKVARHMITMMNMSPYGAGYTCYIDGIEERRMFERT